MSLWFIKTLDCPWYVLFSPWDSLGHSELNRESPSSRRPSPGMHPQRSILRNSECNKSLWNIQAMISIYTRSDRDWLWINWSQKPFLFPAHVRLYQSHSCPCVGSNQSHSCPCVGSYQRLSFTLWEWEHVTHPQRSFSVIIWKLFYLQ